MLGRYPRGPDWPEDGRGKFQLPYKARRAENGFWDAFDRTQLCRHRKKNPDATNDQIRPEMTMTGKGRLRLCETSRMVSNPSISGMKISMISKSKSSLLRHFSRPRRPSGAVTTLVDLFSASKVVRTERIALVVVDH